MILIDKRSGSVELADPLEKMGLPVVLDQFDSGDLTFIGRGTGGRPVAVAIEYKKLGECVGSMRTGRLQKQAERMQLTYEFNWLILVGEIQYNRQGILLRRSGRHEFRPLPGNMTVNELYKRLFVLHLFRGLNWVIVKDERGALKLIETLYRTWTDCDADEHQSHLAMYQPPPLMPLPEEAETFRTFPGVGIKVALAAHRHFNGSITQGVNASAEEWANLTTTDKHGHQRSFGSKAAQDVKRYLR